MTFQPYHYCTLVTQHSQGESGGEGKGEAQLSDSEEEKGEEVERAEKTW